PVMMGGRLLLRPERRMKPLPILSMVTLMPASRAQRVTRSRPCLSRSVRVRRHTPPLGVAPICASSMSESQRRSPLMRSWSMSMADLTVVSMGFSVIGVRSSTSDSGGGQILRALLHGIEVHPKRRALDVAALALVGPQVAVGVLHAAL